MVIGFANYSQTKKQYLLQKEQKVLKQESLTGHGKAFSWNSLPLLGSNQSR